MSSNVNVTVAARVGIEEGFACAVHGSRNVCSKCIYKDFISQNKLFHKNLPEADISHKFYVPRGYEGIFTSPDLGFRSINNGEETRVDVTFYDTIEKKPWKVSFVRSADGRCHLTNWSDCVREKKLSKGDVITFYKLMGKRGTYLMIGVEKKGFVFGVDINKD